MKIVQLWTSTCSFSFSLSNSVYLDPLGEMKYRPPASWHDFIVATTYFLSKRLPNGRLMCMYKLLHDAFVTKQCSSPHQESSGDDVWQSPVSFSSSLVSGVAFVPACGTSVQIVAEASRNSAWSYRCTF